MDNLFWISHRVTYQETDRMGVVYYANYLHWFEMGRTEFIRSKGFAYYDLERQGFFLPVRDVSCRYFQSARYDDIVWIGSQVSAMSPASLSFYYEIKNEEKSCLLASGTTKLVMVNCDGRPVVFPKEMKEILSKFVV